MEKYLLKIKPKHYGIVAFLLTCLAMYIMFSYEEVLSTGRYVILEGDLLAQYVPFIKMLVRDIMEGENLWYSWSLSMGMNTSLCYAYYALSPFNLLYLILYPIDETIVTALLIILKTGLAAYAFQRFSVKVLKCKGMESVVFSVFYAMCSFHVIYNVMIISWIDAFYILPFLCIAIVEFVKSGKWKSLVFLYAYLFVTQFYMAYIVGVFSAVFYLAALICTDQQKIRDKVKSGIRYGFCVVLAIGISAIVWFPALLFLAGNSTGDVAEIRLVANLFDIVKNMFWGQMQGYEGVYPYIYCGIPTLLLVPFFLFNKQIRTKERIAASVMIILCLVCMLCPSAYTFIHAFDAPDNLGFRFAFLLSFIFCGMGCRQYRYAKDISGSIVAAEMIFVSAIYILAYGMQDKSYEKSLLSPIVLLMVNIVWLAVWYGIYLLRRRKRCNKVLMAVLILFFSVTEVITNGYVVYQGMGADLPERHYDTYRTSMSKAMSMVEDDDFYRMYYTNDLVVNSDSWFDYHSISDFNSAMNKTLQGTLSKLGFLSGSNVIHDIGSTPVTEMLFGVKYRIEGVHPYIMATVLPDPVIQTNENALALGYMVEEELLEYDLEENHAFDNMDLLLTAMTGKEIHCFMDVPEECVVIETENAYAEELDDGVKIGRDSHNEDAGYIRYYIPYRDEYKAYVQFEFDQVRIASNSPILLGGNENSIRNDSFLTGAYAKEMLMGEDGYEVTIQILPEDAYPIKYRQAVFCYYNEEELSKAYDILSQNQMEILEYGNTYIDAGITVPEERTLLFTSIPYDEGWSVYVDGIRTETKAVVGDAFLALELEPGYHELEFEYEAPGARTGMMVSAISLVVFGGCVFTGWIKTKKRKAKEGNLKPDVEDRTE